MTTTIHQLSSSLTKCSKLVAVNGANAAPDVAPRITGLTIAAQTGTSVLLQWDPASGGGAPVTGYEVAYSGDSGATWTVVPTGGSTSPSVAILRAAKSDDASACEIVNDRHAPCSDHALESALLCRR